MGNQGTSENGLREAVEVVKAGIIGDVKEVHIWTNRPIWDQGIPRPPAQPVPPHVHWDLFLGPAPEQHYNSAYHPFSWRGWLDFGTGALGDMACHTANMAVMACDLFEPLAFEAVKNSGIVDNASYPDNSVIKFEFGSRGNLAPCTLYWYDGGNLPGEDVLSNSEVPDRFARRIKERGRREAMSSGSLIVGSKGKLFSPNDYGAQYFLLPEKDFANIQKPDQTLPRVTTRGETDQRHMSEFIAACKGEGKTMSNFGYAGRLTETILCGNLALRVNQRIEWDAASMKSSNCPDANKFIHREYRKGYSI
jgi:predicted dehydrogenase